MRGKLQLQCEPLDLREVVISQAEAVDGSAKKSELVIQLNLPSNPVVVYGDRVRLGQVVTNLLTNAIKFTPPQGTIDIKLVAEDNRAILSIQDSGIGMSAELLPLIFEPFRQGDTSMTRTRGGLGIGLTIARSLTEQHGGTISAKSNGPGRGSEFFFSLPIMEDKMSMSQSIKPQDSATQYRRILLVEDNPDLRATMTLLLEMLGHTVLQADNGMNALEIGANQVADLALIDIGLPDLNGYELAQRFREHPVLKNMYLVALTGYASQEHRDKALAAGFDDYLAKPVEMDALQRILDQL
jgi:CheY-like chemotaxis protein